MGNPLDLNNLPDDFHGKQPLDDSSSSASAGLGGIYRKKKNGAKDESGKVYECRFCSLKFCKSQALGGHMNRHRQERETETLNRARQLVFSNDSLLPHLPHQLGGQPVVHGGFHHQAGCNIGSTTVYPARLFSGTSNTIPPPQQQPPPPPPPTQHMYTSPAAARLHNPYSSSQYPPPPSHQNQNQNQNQINDYFVGHVCSGNTPPFSLQSLNNGSSSATATASDNYTCIGAPVGQGFTLAARDMSPSSVNRYHQDGF